MGRVNEGVIRVTVETADGDTSFFGGCFDLIEVADAPIPKLDGFKPVGFGSGKTIFERELRVERIDAGTMFNHDKSS